MIVNSELITVLAITNINSNKVNLVGITENEQWIRTLNLSKEDLLIKGINLKPFHKIKVFNLNHEMKNTRREDRSLIRSKKEHIQLVKELNLEERKILLDKFLDNSIAGIINNYRTIGLIKPVISEIEFSWNSYRCSYEARFVFEDSNGDKYNFLCNDPVWQNYWIDFIRRDPTNINSQLLKMQWTLNANNTYFVVGFTKRFLEIPGLFDGRWPLILGVHTIEEYSIT